MEKSLDRYPKEASFYWALPKLDWMRSAQQVVNNAVQPLLGISFIYGQYAWRYPIVRKRFGSALIGGVIYYPVLR